MGVQTDDVVAALRDFVSGIEALDAGPAGAAVTRIEITGDGRRTGLDLTGPAAAALVRALRGYHDPRDNGPCDYCGGRLDANLICADCARPQGVFGQLVLERAARHAADPDPDPE
jgi:hypothetical protein